LTSATFSNVPFGTLAHLLLMRDTVKAGTGSGIGSGAGSGIGSGAGSGIGSGAGAGYPPPPQVSENDLACVSDCLPVFHNTIFPTPNFVDRPAKQIRVCVGASFTENQKL